MTLRSLIRNLKFDINNQTKEIKHIYPQLSCKSWSRVCITTWQLHGTAQLSIPISLKCMQPLDHSCMAPCPRPPPSVTPAGLVGVWLTAKAFRYLSLLSWTVKPPWLLTCLCLQSLKSKSFPTSPWRLRVRNELSEHIKAILSFLSLKTFLHNSLSRPAPWGRSIHLKKTGPRKWGIGNKYGCRDHLHKGKGKLMWMLLPADPACKEQRGNLSEQWSCPSHVLDVTGF